MNTNYENTNEIIEEPPKNPSIINLEDIINDYCYDISNMSFISGVLIGGICGYVAGYKIGLFLNR